MSTRGGTQALDFAGVLLAGLARDGGLYVPACWPQLAPRDWAGLDGLDYPALACRLFQPYIGAMLDPAALEALVRDAYAGFRHRAVAPLVQLGPHLWLLELFHGPTFAFKDLAMQVLSRLMDVALAHTGGRITIVGATSGDTGSAAIEAFRHAARVDLFMLHPAGRVSPIQRRQMTTVRAPHIHNIALDGTFDDAQALVKALFEDLDFRDRHRLAGVNSINWARVMAQTAYFAASALALGAPARTVSFSVPTGNFGDILAGYAAHRMGLPVQRLVVATNENDILARCLATGRYERDAVRATQSPSMDIQVSSNFERLLFEAYDRDAGAIRTLMAELAAKGGFSVAARPLARIRDTFDARRIDEETTTRTIRSIAAETGIILDPHTAVGVAAARDLKPPGPVVCLATAHPGKFSDAVARAIGRAPPLPDALAALDGLPEQVSAMANDLAALKRFIAERSRVGA